MTRRRRGLAPSGASVAAVALVFSSMPEGALERLQIARLSIDLAVILCAAAELAKTSK